MWRNPFVEKNGERCTRREMGRWREGGRIELMGGKESQVKIRSIGSRLGDRGRAGGARGDREAVVVAREEAGGRSGWWRTTGSGGRRNRAGSGRVAQVFEREAGGVHGAAGVRAAGELPRRGNGKWIGRRCRRRGRSLWVRGMKRRRGNRNAVAGIWRKYCGWSEWAAGQLFCAGGSLAAGGAGDCPAAAGAGSGSRSGALLLIRCSLHSAEWIVDQQLATFDSDDLANALKQMEEAVANSCVSMGLRYGARVSRKTDCSANTIAAHKREQLLRLAKSLTLGVRQPPFR